MNSAICGSLQTMVHNLIGPSFDDRSLENQAGLVVREAGYRLRGMSTLLYGLAAAQQQQRGHNAEQFSFLGACAADLALSLERAHATLRIAEEYREDAARKAKRKGKGKAD